MSRFCLSITLLRILLIGCFEIATLNVGWPSNAEKEHDRTRLQEKKSTAHGNLNLSIGEHQVHSLIEGWCSAYARLDSVRIADLEGTNIDIVDQFGALHRLYGHKDQQRFWLDGFDMISAGDFHPVCKIENVVFIRPDVAIAHTNMWYPNGIRLKEEGHISPYAEIHSFVVSKHRGAWLIVADSITRQADL
jgi:hypothetical protein